MERKQFPGATIMQKRAIVSLILTTVAITLSGCSNSKAANKDNFTKLLNQYVTNNPYKVGEGMFGSYQCIIELFEIPQEGYVTDGMASLGSYEVLKNAGILTSKVVKEQDSGWGRKTTVVQYELSDKGRQIAKQKTGNSYFLPYCKVAFKEVKSFTEPADAFGAKVSQVNYTYVIEKVDDWVNHPEILQKYPTVKRVLDSVGQPKEGQKTLVLTNEGWSTGEK
ncbi:hypothetical protein K9N68_35120 (plasmid) [Kovacikia minuta CCNUW1]|uniref:hypothetical protein n=1 Tax=Kovacikia minuta TaxID=2931930 RepID=UPI001CCB2ED4|nr:hypothetical protein [Kovacikia minuta]UBF30431.1 hypothetical protein K9N68_35120 [Kovacikia minuta CCNUW1]